MPAFLAKRLYNYLFDWRIFLARFKKKISETYRVDDTPPTHEISFLWYYSPLTIFTFLRFRVQYQNMKQGFTRFT